MPTLVQCIVFDTGMSCICTFIYKMVVSLVKSHGSMHG